MKKIIIRLLQTIWVLIGFVALYALLGYTLPFIEIPAKKVSEPKTTEIFILTNGVHTDLVVPIQSPQFDWSKEVPFSNTVSKRTDFKYLALGWGDKGFYLETPTWSQLKPSVAFRAAFWLSKSAMHCTFYDQMKEGKDCKKILITTKQYEDLIRYIRAKFDRDENGKLIFIPTKAVYGKDDAFYDAKGSYSFLYTCNTWANNGLKAAGQKAALWTPSDFGIFQHYP